MICGVKLLMPMEKHLKLALSLHDEPFFRTMSSTTVARIANYVYHREYEPRQIIFFPDDVCDHVYWVRDGRIKITRASDEGRELAFQHLFPGDIFGEACLLEKGKREAYAEAMTSATLCLMRADDFRRIVADEHEVTLMLAKVLCRRVVEIEHVLAETVFKTVRSRVASGLLRLYQRSSRTERGAIRITHQEIAGLVGSTRETTTAVLHNLRQQGIVTMANRRVIVLDPVALEHVARSS